jgi:O-antigen ligase
VNWWLLSTIAAAGLFALIVWMSTGRTVARPALLIGWCATVFTAEAALAGAGTTSGLTPPKLAALGLITAAAAWLLLQPPQTTEPTLAAPLRWALCYLSWLFLCAFFAPDPISALIRVAQIGLPILVVLCLRRATGPQTGLLTATVLGCAAHVFYAVFFDADYVGVEGLQRLTGLLIANTFGFAAAVAMAAAFGLWLNGFGSWATGLLAGFTVAVSGYAIVEAAARTAAIALLVALPITVYASRTRRRGRVAISAIGIGVIGLYALLQPQLWASTVTIFARGNDKLSSLTGRVPLWSHLLDAIANNPMLGYGPAALRDQAAELTDYLTIPEAGLRAAHNALMEAFVAGGLAGGLFWLAIMVSLARHVWRTPALIRPPAVAVYVILMITSITGSSTAGIGIGWLAILALTALPSAAKTEGGRSPARPDKVRNWRHAEAPQEATSTAL